MKPSKENEPTPKAGAPKGNQYASKGGVSGKGRVVVDLGPLKARAVREANRKNCSLKQVIVDALEAYLS